MPSSSHASYDRASYWDGVASRVVARQSDPELAGNAGPFHRYRRGISETRLFELLPVEGLSVLEVGCGPGGNLSVLAQRHPRRLVGADVSPAMVELARSRGVADIFHVEGDVLPFEDQELDSTLTHTVLQHNPPERLPQVVAEIARVTRASILLIEDTATFYERSHGGSYWVRRNEEYIALVTAHGFRFCGFETSDIWLSEKVWLAIRRVMSYVDRSTHREGEQVSRFEHQLEGAALSLTRPLDRFFPQLSGKTALRFERV
jgi:SAM-dependent methyltransferase